MINVKVKKLKENAIIPIYGSEKAGCCDLYACIENEVTIGPNSTAKIGTGLAFELPENYAALIYARSGMATKQGLAPANKVGYCDEDYRGEYIVALHNHSNEPRTVKHGDRIAQLAFVPYIQASFTEVDELSDTKRGEGGFGSTGIR